VANADPGGSVLKARQWNRRQTSMPRTGRRLTLGAPAQVGEPDQHAGRRVSSLLGLVLGTTLLMSCGPIGGEDILATSTPVLLPAASPVVQPLPTSIAPTAATPPPATPVASPALAGSSPTAASPAPASPTARPKPRPTRTPRARPTATETPRPPVASDCVAPEEPPEPAQDGPVTVTADGVNLRRAPGTTCDIIQVVEAGTAATPRSGPVEADDRLWILIDISGTEGWVALEFVE
jgi:uncharacterized protein YgiM (DUF1202 family)